MRKNSPIMRRMRKLANYADPHRRILSDALCNGFLLYRHTDDCVFGDFPKISDHFPNISEDSIKLVQRSHEHCRTFSGNFQIYPKICEDCRRLSKTFKKDPKMFRSYTNKLKYNLRDKLDISEIIDILTSEDMENMPFQFV